MGREGGEREGAERGGKGRIGSEGSRRSDRRGDAEVESLATKSPPECAAEQKKEETRADCGGCRRCRAACRASARARARGNAASAGGYRTLRHSAQHARPGEKNFLRRVRLQLCGAGGGEGTHGQRETPHTKFLDDGCRRFGRMGGRVGVECKSEEGDGARSRRNDTRGRGAGRVESRGRVDEIRRGGAAETRRDPRGSELNGETSHGHGPSKIFGWARRVGRRAHQAVTDGFVRGLNILDGGALADLLASTHVEQGRTSVRGEETRALEMVFARRSTPKLSGRLRAFRLRLPT